MIDPQGSVLKLLTPDRTDANSQALAKLIDRHRDDVFGRLFKKLTAPPPGFAWRVTAGEPFALGDKWTIVYTAELVESKPRDADA